MSDKPRQTNDELRGHIEKMRGIDGDEPIRIKMALAWAEELLTMRVELALGKDVAPSPPVGPIMGDALRTDFPAWLADLWAWQRKTFPGQTPAGVFKHLQKEISELTYDIGEPFEIADCLMLLFCLCGHFQIDVFRTLAMKDAMNRQRVWQRRADGSWRHVPGRAAKKCSVGEAGAQCSAEGGDQ